MGGVWMSRLLKNNLMDDPFNNENESFQQETRLIGNEYSINLPTKFYYNKQWNNCLLYTSDTLDIGVHGTAQLAALGLRDLVVLGFPECQQQMCIRDRYSGTLTSVA